MYESILFEREKNFFVIDIYIGNLRQNFIKFPAIIDRHSSTWVLNVHDLDKIGLENNRIYLLKIKKKTLIFLKIKQ